MFIDCPKTYLFARLDVNINALEYEILARAISQGEILNFDLTTVGPRWLRGVFFFLPLCLKTERKKFMIVIYLRNGTIKGD